MAIYLYFGLPGCGKTTLMTHEALKAVESKNYRNVYCNVPISVPGVTHICNNDIGKYNLNDGIILIDEATIFADSRDFKSFGKDKVEYFLLHRHFNVDVKLFCQQWDAVDKKIRTITDRVYYVYKGFWTGAWITNYYRIPYGIIIPDPRKNGGEKLGEIIQGYAKPNILYRLFCTKRLYRPKYYKYFDSWDRPYRPELPERHVYSYLELEEKERTDKERREQHKMAILLRSFYGGAPMIKRILVICLVALLCIPCLGVLAYAATEYTYVSSSDTDGMFVGTMADMLPVGQYSLSVTGEYYGIPVTHEFPLLNVSYSPMVFQGMNAMGFLHQESVSFDGVSFDVLLQVGYVEQYNLFAVALYIDDVAVPASFVFSSPVSDGSASDPVYFWTSGQVVSGYRFPSAGVYNVRITYEGQVVESVVDFSDMSSGGLFYFSFPRFDVMPENSIYYEGTSLSLYYDGFSCGLMVMSSITEILFDGATVEFLPVSEYNGVPVLMSSISASLTSLVRFSGYVINSILAPGGVMAQLWPLVGLGVAFVLVIAGVGLIRKFSP